MVMMKNMIEDSNCQKFDMIWLDPPYFDWETGEKKPDHRDLSFYTMQLLKPNGVVLLCGTIPQLINDYKWWDRFFNVVFEIIQYKKIGGTIPTIWRPMRAHENIWCMIRSNARVSDTKINIKRTAKIKGKKIDKSKLKNAFRISHIENGTILDAAGYIKDVFECEPINLKHPEYLGHPTQKPMFMMSEIIKLVTEEGDWILDPFAGSGTTGYIAEMEGRNCLMMEKEKKYVEIIEKRMSLMKKQEKIDTFIQ